MIIGCDFTIAAIIDITTIIIITITMIVIIGRAGQTLLFDWRTPHPLLRTRHSGFIGFCFNTISTSVISCHVLQATFGLSHTAEYTPYVQNIFDNSRRDCTLTFKLKSIVNKKWCHPCKKENDVEKNRQRRKFI